MGRKKITIKQIADPKLRHITFNKRKNGLIKKAAELALLCNVNMLLVFEDGAGNLVQFSKNKINNITEFFQSCKYNKLVELTAKEYPNFFKVNHYKKSKYPDQENQDDFDEDDSEINNNQEIYGFPPSEAKQEISKNLVKDPKAREGELKKEVPHHLNSLIPAQPKSEMPNFTDSDRVAMMTANGAAQDVNKKNKGKQSLRLNVTKPEEGAKPQPKMPNGEGSAKVPLVSGDINEPAYSSYNQYKKDSFPEDQMKQIADKNLEYNASTFITPNIDPAKRLSGVPDPINSPFNFYPSNGRLRPFNNYGINPFGNEEAFNNILKSYSSFGFPMPGNPQFMGKPGANGEIDEKLFDTTKMLNYFNQTGQTPLNRQNMFNFPPNDFQKIAINDAMRQGNGRNEPEYYGNYPEEPHDEMPPVYKGDPRFEGNLPSANLGNRRYNSDTYFNNGFEDEYGERQKKIKHN